MTLYVAGCIILTGVFPSLQIFVSTGRLTSAVSLSTTVQPSPVDSVDLLSHQFDIDDEDDEFLTTFLDADWTLPCGFMDELAMGDAPLLRLSEYTIRNFAPTNLHESRSMGNFIDEEAFFHHQEDNRYHLEADSRCETQDGKDGCVFTVDRVLGHEGDLFKPHTLLFKVSTWFLRKQYCVPMLFFINLVARVLTLTYSVLARSVGKAMDQNTICGCRTASLGVI
jgi:hypothetical protein